jgi:hypothetical protein
MEPLPKTIQNVEISIEKSSALSIAALFMLLHATKDNLSGKGLKIWLEI